MAAAVERNQPHLPDHVIDIDTILRLILTKPTKSAVRMSFLSKQWEAIWSSVPILDFDEGEPHDDDDHKLQHTKFINFVNKYLEFREKVDKQLVLLDKFKLHMMRYDDTRIDKWLSFAFDRSVEELDISFGSKNDCHKYCMLIPAASAKSITSLKLEHVVFEDGPISIRLIRVNAS